MKYCYYCGAEMREGLSFCTKCGKAAPSPIQPNSDKANAPEAVETKSVHLDSSQQSQTDKVTDEKIQTAKPNTVRNVEINQSPDSDELSTAVNSTCRELANLAALGFKKWKTLNTKGKIAAVITALVIWSMLRRMFFLF